jgi:cell wall-associated NlpC family hydrolase
LRQSRFVDSKKQNAVIAGHYQGKTRAPRRLGMANVVNPGKVIGTVLTVAALALVVAGFAAGRRAVVQGRGNVSLALDAVIGEKVLESQQTNQARAPRALTSRTPDRAASPAVLPVLRPKRPAAAADPVACAVGPLDAASAQLGAPYRLGGTGPENGFDCSGLTSHAFRAAGIELPRTSREQFAVGLTVPRQGLAPGDLVFFKGRSGVSHVGIYQGGGQFIHSSRRGGEVGFDSLDAPYWDRNYAGARRVAASGREAGPYAAMAAPSADPDRTVLPGLAPPWVRASLSIRGLAKQF